MSDIVPPSPTGEEPLIETSTSASVIRKDVLKVATLCAVLVGGLVLVHVTGLEEWFKNVPELVERIQAMGIMAPLVFVFASAALVAVGVPRLVLCPVAGMAFGFLFGLLWAQVGTVLGSYATFLFARWAGRDFVVRHRPRMGKLAVVFEPRSVMAVALIRQLPITAGLLNLMLAVSPVKHSRFLIGTAIGILPEAIAVTLIGSGVVKQSLEEATGYVTVASVLLLTVWIVSAFCARKLRRPADANQVLADEGQGDD